PWASIAAPYLDPDTPVVDAVVYRARASAVDVVLVAGEVVVEGGRVTRVDKARVLEELAASLRAPLAPHEERRRRLSRAVFPPVAEFSAGWLDGAPRDPFYSPSSRT